MYVAFPLPLSVTFSLSPGSFYTKTAREIHSIGGLTVGGQTGARFTQRKVQITLGQSVQGGARVDMLPGDGSCQERERR